MRHTKSHTNNRRSHHAIKVKNLSKCENCGSSTRPHAVCLNCGKYQGRQVVDVLKKLDKKEKKRKQQELDAQEAQAQAGKPLDADVMSKK